MLEPSRSALLIEAFANTVNLEFVTDAIDTPEKLSTWLSDQGLPNQAPGSAVADPASHERCLRLRAGIREELGLHVGVKAKPQIQQTADDVLRTLPVLAGVRGTPLTPAPELAPIDAALAELAIAWVELRITGEAARLKRCAEHTCELVFWDASKNASRRWCSMRACGNRAKYRRYAARNADKSATM